MDEILKNLGIARNVLADRGLCQHEEAVSLELADVGNDNKKHYLIREAAAAWQQLKKAAEADGETIFIVSAFRSIERQVEIIRGKLDRGQDIDEILSVCAPPGYSEHHTGRAIDVSTPESEDLSADFANTSAFTWLCDNAQRFHYFLSYPEDNTLGYQYEPWHWCFVPLINTGQRTG
jgi:D-alanyl-D-alanine carboxypeptidase